MPIIYEKVELLPREPRVVGLPVRYVCDGRDCTEVDDFGPNGYASPYWIPIEVHAGEPQEEGWAVAKKIFCETCAIGILDHLIDLGFGVHYHGSTNLLEPNYCDDPCPTPEWGPYEDPEDM